nr:hypothetical protein [Tanacetum cinerariifolium]
MGAGGPNDEDQKWPPWLKPMLNQNFFTQCKQHADSHKSECNMFCLDCIDKPLCSLCLNDHKDHRAIQVSIHEVQQLRKQKVVGWTRKQKRWDPRDGSGGKKEG